MAAGNSENKEAVNTFNGGLVKDLNPLSTPNNVLVDCINGTIVTYDGNELSLQNEMGNAPIIYLEDGVEKLAQLPAGYIPVAIKEYNEIFYIVALKETEDGSTVTCLGSFPAPDTEASEILNNNVSITEVINGNISVKFDDLSITKYANIALLLDEEDGRIYPWDSSEISNDLLWYWYQNNLISFEIKTNSIDTYKDGEVDPAIDDVDFTLSTTSLTNPTVNIVFKDFDFDVLLNEFYKRTDYDGELNYNDLTVNIKPKDDDGEYITNHTLYANYLHGIKLTITNSEGSDTVKWFKFDTTVNSEFNIDGGIKIAEVIDFSEDGSSLDLEDYKIKFQIYTIFGTLATEKTYDIIDGIIQLTSDTWKYTNSLSPYTYASYERESYNVIKRFDFDIEFDFTNQLTESIESVYLEVYDTWSDVSMILTTDEISTLDSISGNFKIPVFRTWAKDDDYTNYGGIWIDDDEVGTIFETDSRTELSRRTTLNTIIKSALIDYQNSYEEELFSNDTLKHNMQDFKYHLAYNREYLFRFHYEFTDGSSKNIFKLLNTVSNIDLENQDSIEDYSLTKIKKLYGYNYGNLSNNLLSGATIDSPQALTSEYIDSSNLASTYTSILEDYESERNSLYLLDDETLTVKEYYDYNLKYLINEYLPLRYYKVGDDATEISVAKENIFFNNFNYNNFFGGTDLILDEFIDCSFKTELSFTTESSNYSFSNNQYIFNSLKNTSSLETDLSSLDPQGNILGIEDSLDIFYDDAGQNESTNTDSIFLESSTEGIDLNHNFYTTDTDFSEYTLTLDKNDSTSEEIVILLPSGFKYELDKRLNYTYEITEETDGSLSQKEKLYGDSIYTDADFSDSDDQSVLGYGVNLSNFNERDISNITNIFWAQHRDNTTQMQFDIWFKTGNTENYYDVSTINYFKYKYFNNNKWIDTFTNLYKFQSSELLDNSTVLTENVEYELFVPLFGGEFSTISNNASLDAISITNNVYIVSSVYEDGIYKSTAPLLKYYTGDVIYFDGEDLNYYDGNDKRKYIGLADVELTTGSDWTYESGKLIPGLDTSCTVTVTWFTEQSYSKTYTIV